MPIESNACFEVSMLWEKILGYVHFRKRRYNLKYFRPFSLQQEKNVYN